MGVEPTKLTALMSGWARMASTATLSPCTTLNTPSGSPASAHSEASSREADGSFSDGLRMNVLPHAMASGNIHIGTMAGKFNGVMPATTPTGCRIEYESTPVNCGRVTFKTNPETGERAVVGRLPGEPIVAEEDFERVCAIFAARRRGRPTRYLCAAVAVCGAPGCGFPLYGRARKELKLYTDGSMRRHYWCVKSIGGCGKTSIDQRALDKAAGILTVEILSDPRNTAAIETAAAAIADEAARLDVEIAEAEAVADALADRLGRGEISLTRYDVAVRPLDKRIAKLKDERAALPASGSAPVPLQPAEASREQWQLRWDNAEDKERRDLLKMALRGRHLVIAPVERGAGGVNQAEITRRIRIK